MSRAIHPPLSSAALLPPSTSPTPGAVAFLTSPVSNDISSRQTREMLTFKAVTEKMAERKKIDNSLKQLRDQLKELTYQYEKSEMTERTYSHPNQGKLGEVL